MHAPAKRRAECRRWRERPCVSGAGSLSIDSATKALRIGTRTLSEGDIITIDGATGEVMAGEVPTVQP